MNGIISCQVIVNFINKKKTQLYQDKINSGFTSVKKRFRTTNNLLCASFKKLPISESELMLANKFSTYFQSKLDSLLKQVSVSESVIPRNEPACTLKSFNVVTKREVISSMISSSDTSAYHDPFPTPVL